MKELKAKLAIGSILHDTGKLLFRYNDSRDHSTSGHDFLKGFISDSDILGCVKYHHSAALKNADLPKDALCYITYIADNIAAFSDRRKNETGEGGFVRGISCESVFNILNGASHSASYSPIMLTETNEINYPSETEKKYSEDFYGGVADRLKDSLKGTELSADFINSLCEVFEACTSYIPSSTNKGELRDISLYDHVKLTAALSLCIYDYLESENIHDLRGELFTGAEKFYDKKAFLLYSADISGIQNFIYNIGSKGALKGLRARSFWLELAVESAVDELLDRLSLARCNVMYTGGGHTYIILPNTETVKNEIAGFEKELNQWMIDNFGAELFIGGGYCECSANSLRNKPSGSYGKIFTEVSRRISSAKINRYSADEIIKLNTPKKDSDSKRECAVCGRSDRLDEYKDICCCEICRGLFALSDSIIGDGGFFTVLSEKPEGENSVILPFGNYLTADTEDSLRKRIKSDETYVRSYAKNKMYTGRRLASRIWAGDYCAAKEFSGLVSKCEGIKRLGVFRADIDNLGQTFIKGFSGEYSTVSRTSELSSKLSLFFKHDINSILKDPRFKVYHDLAESRNVTIVYSGGDDVFAVGGWEDIIGFAVDLRNSFRRFSLGTLSVSGGIGIFPEKYPIYEMASETGELEDISKTKLRDKNGDPVKDSVTLFDESGCYRWDTFTEKVVGEKLRILREFLDGNTEKGKALLYNMLSLIRETYADKTAQTDSADRKLNLARFAYLIARMIPENKDDKEAQEKYSQFKRDIYGWITDDEDRRQLVTAIYLYVYSVRENEENERNEA